MPNDDRRDEETPILKPKDRIDYLFRVISRFDFYINSANTKASLIIAWNGALIAAILLKYSEILSMFQHVGWVKVTAVALLSSLGLCSIISSILVLRVVFPFLRPTSKVTGRILHSESMLYFGSVAAMGAEDYHKEITDSSLEDLLSDLADQTVTIAQGLQGKMLIIQKSVISAGIGFVIILCLLVLRAFAV